MPSSSASFDIYGAAANQLLVAGVRRNDNSPITITNAFAGSALITCPTITMNSALSSTGVFLNYGTDPFSWDVTITNAASNVNVALWTNTYYRVFSVIPGLQFGLLTFTGTIPGPTAYPYLISTSSNSVVWARAAALPNPGTSVWSFALFPK